MAKHAAVVGAMLHGGGRSGLCDVFARVQTGVRRKQAPTVVVFMAVVVRGVRESDEVWACWLMVRWRQVCVVPEVVRRGKHQKRLGSGSSRQTGIEGRVEALR